MLGGTVTSASGDASSIATISSTNSGLPSAASRMRSRSPLDVAGELAEQPRRSPRGRAAPAAPSPRAACRRPSPAGGRAAPAAPCTGAGSARRATSRRRARPGRGTRPPPSAGRPRRRRAAARAPPPRRGGAPRRRSPPSTRLPVLAEQRRASGRATRGSSSRSVRPQLLDRLDDRPVRDALAVGEAPAADDRRVQPPQELRDEPRLADARDAEQREQLARAVAIRRARTPPAAGAARARDRRTARRSRRRGRPAAHRDQAVRLDRLRLALQLERLDRLDVDGATHELHRLRADVHLVRRRGLLEPRGDVDRVAGDEPLARAGDDLAGVDADARLHAERRQRVAHLRGGAHRAQRVVLVQHRNAEHGHHRVADELLHRSAVALDDRPHPLEVAREHARAATPDRPTRRATSSR